MYKLTLTLFAFFSLVLPIVAIPGPRSKVDGLEKRTTGVGTYFIPGLGACGRTNSASDLIVAISSAIYDGGAHCFDLVEISSGGKSVQAQVVDECPSCNANDLDLSPATFEKFAPLAQGEIDITWEFV